MKRIKLALKNKESSPKSWEQVYEAEIVNAIRQKYSVNQELAILRQRDTKPTEFEEYNKFVEECKAKVKTEVDNG